MVPFGHIIKAFGDFTCTCHTHLSPEKSKLEERALRHVSPANTLWLNVRSESKPD
jgi:hypothetical protein